MRVFQPPPPPPTQLTLLLLTTSRSAFWYPFVCISCAPTLESTSSLISIVASWLGLTGTLARRLFKKSCLSDINKLQAAREISCELIVISWKRSFTVRVNESGPKSRDHSTPSLEIEKILLLYCRIKGYKMTTKLILWSTVSTNGVSARLCHKKIDFCLF